jgi:hypothetical protein
MPKRPVENWEQKRDEWVVEVERLVSEAETWAQAEGWLTHREARTLTEELIGSYTVPSLRIHHPAATLLLEPVARYVVGASGRVDLAVFPSYDKLLIVRGDDGGWRFASASREDFEEPWTRDDFVRLAGELAAA